MDALKKMDAVAANKIWAETLKREKACIRINEDFRVNPKLLKRNRLPKNPTKSNPFELVETANSEEAKDPYHDPQLKKSIEQAQLPPQKKYRWPMTSAQMLGWSWKEGMEDHADSRKWLATHKQSEIVKYAENYCLAFGKSPYASR